MKKSILTVHLLFVSLFLSLQLVYSSSFTSFNVNRADYVKEIPTATCGVQINSVFPLGNPGSNSLTFLVDATLQPGTTITNVFFDFTFESGVTTSLSGSSLMATVPVTCDDKITSVTVTILAQGGSLFCGDQFSQIQTEGCVPEG